jgi:transposase-like protein
VNELIPTREGRPAVVTVGGTVVHVSVHDAYHLRMRQEAKQRLAAAHPDAGGTARAFRRASEAHDRWLAREKAWYASVGIEPPQAIPARIAPAQDARLVEIRCASCKREIVVEKGTLTTVCGDCNRRYKERRGAEGHTRRSADRLMIEPVDLRAILRDTERRYLVKALESADQNHRVAARLLQIPRTTLIDAIKRHGLESRRGATS